MTLRVLGNESWGNDCVFERGPMTFIEGDPSNCVQLTIATIRTNSEQLHHNSIVYDCSIVNWRQFELLIVQLVTIQWLIVILTIEL